MGFVCCPGGCFNFRVHFSCGTPLHPMSCESLYRGMSYLQKQNPMATPTKVKAVVWGACRHDMCVRERERRERECVCVCVC